MSRPIRHRAAVVVLFLALAPLCCAALRADSLAEIAEVAVGAQYDTTHVYVAPGSMDAFVRSFVETFGGKPSPQLEANVLPVPSKTKLRYVWTPVGTLSVFEFLTPLPFPFGSERNGFLVRDMDQALSAARAAGAEVIVEPFKDPIGIDAVIQWDGGVKMQLYWHFTPPHYEPLQRVPDNRVYVSRDRVSSFVRGYRQFARGRLVEDNPGADAGEIGQPGSTYRRIRIESLFGNTLVLVTDGHLPYPFGREMTGYEVGNLKETLDKARVAGASILSPVYEGADRSSAMVQFPGGYIAEIHAPKAP